MPMARLLKFDGLRAGITLDVDQRFLDALDSVFVNWPYVLGLTGDGDIFASVRFQGGKYQIDSPFMDAPKFYNDPVNALCFLIVELAWAHLRARPDLLCLHGAAVMINGRLVVFPSTRRAGKSTFSVALLAAGYRLFTDDFLPLQIETDGQICGVSHGISPRLRLPIPDQIGALAQAYIQHRNSISNRQYRYVSPRSTELASFGQAAPLGALVLLDHQPGKKQVMRRNTQSEALKALITQNFSRAMNASGILRVLAAVTENTPAYVLQFDQIEPAIRVLAQTCTSWETDPAKIDKANGETFRPAPVNTGHTEVFDWQRGPLVQATGVTDVATRDEHFLAGPSGRQIHYLNASAAIIWRLLAEPADLAQVSEMLAAIYPDQKPGQIHQDVQTTIGGFVKNGLIRQANANHHDQNIEISQNVVNS